MRKIIYMAFILLMACSSRKTSEPLAIDTLTPVIEIPVEQNTLTIATTSEKKESTSDTTHITDKEWLVELAMYPFLKDMDAMKATLDSLGVAATYENGEYGGLSYDSAEISFNQSYGISICQADIRSRLLPLGKGIHIGMTRSDFLSLTAIEFASEKDQTFEYHYAANEHSYTIRFIFKNKVLVRFYYEKDPCVIYD